MKENFRLIALGGVDEPGRNSYVLETKDGMILLDAGSSNFTNKSLGVDMILPDFGYVLDNKDKFKAILISHGHIDQMGALNALLNQVSVPVYASKYTIKFLKTYVDKKHWNMLKEINYHQPIHVGKLTIECFGLSHAIFGNFGYVITDSNNKSVAYATDYNFDQSKTKFARTDVNQIVSLANKHDIEVLLTESISADKTGIATANKEYVRSFERIIEEAKGRLIIGLYSSNLAGMTTIIRAAEKYHKKIVIIGRDLLKYVNIAREEGYLVHQHDIFARVGDMDNIDPQDLIVVVSGLYSEPFIELVKMANHNHGLLQINEQDTVLIACKAYDEIESYAQAALDQIARTNRRIKQQNLNAPSHAHQEDIKLLINLFDPKFVIPIKGEYRKLKVVKNMMKDIDRDSSDCCIIRAGEILAIYDDYCLVENDIYLEPQLISSEEEDINHKLMVEREILADNGYVVVELIYYKGENEFCQEPTIISGGLINFNDDEDVINLIKKIIYSYADKGLDKNELIAKIRNKLSRVMLDLIGKKPLILVSKVEINKERIKG